MEQDPLGHRPSWPPIDPAQVSIVFLSPRPVYTLCFHLPRQTLWDIPQPLLPLPRCSLFACHLSTERSALLLRGTTERNRSSQVRRINGTLLVLPRLASRRCPSLAISFSVRFLFPALLRAVGAPTSLFQDLLASLAKVASDGGEINRYPQSCIHLNCRVMCSLSEAPHRFVDSSGLRQATCRRGWSTGSTTLSGTRPPQYYAESLLLTRSPFFSCCKTLKFKLVHSF